MVDTVNVKRCSEGSSGRMSTLQARKQALQEELAARNEELRRLCIQEAELTGSMPSEVPLEPGESPPPFRRMVGTGYAYPQNLINKLKTNEVESISALELEKQVQVGISEAALGLVHNGAASKACIEAGLPLKASVVPKSPVKKSLGISRRSKKATSVSFLEQSENHLSIIYDPTNEKTYLEQCFYDIKLIGEGSFGVVFSVRFREDDQLYAIKKSKSPFYSNNDKRTKLEEVRKHEMIPKHPNCVQLYSSWVEDNFLYLQLELCDTSLEHYASENHNISEQTLWNILADMLLAVKNLHDRNLIHLDIKLENILMCSNGIYKLADFGLVSDINQIKGDTLEGDQKYLAPELLTGHFTKAADIFSLGIVMLELACDLLLPSNGILWQELRNDIFPDTCIENIPHELLNIIKKMMHSDHLKRPCVDDLLQIDIIQTILAQRKTGQSQLHVPLEFEQRMGITAVLQVEQGPQTSQLQQNDDDSVDNKTTPKGQDLSVISHLHNVVSSTPNHHSRTEQQWKLNVEISPIEQSDLVAPLCDCSGGWISKRRSEKNSVNIQPTPKTSFKKSRINTGNGSVGRRLF